FDELWSGLGRMPWKRLVEPALQLARSGVPLPPMHAVSLEMLAEVFTLERGRELFARDERTLEAGEILLQPGLVQALEALAEEGARSVYRGTLAEAFLGIDGIVVTPDDLRDYRARWREPTLVPWHGFRVATRSGLSGFPGFFTRLARPP